MQSVLGRMRLSALDHVVMCCMIATLIAACTGPDGGLAPSVDPRLSKAADQSQDGKLVFHSTRDGDFDVYAMNADGSAQTRLTSTAEHDIGPLWSPDGKYVAFNRFPADFSSCEVYVMNADGSGVRQLTTGGGYDFGGIWSPDGKQIAFASGRDGADDVYIINVDGSGLLRLTTNAYVRDVTAWSPDGKQIAFIGYRDYVEQAVGDFEIYAVKVNDGSAITKLTDNEVDDDGIRAGWSPNGKLFTFSSRRDGGDLDIFFMNADGSNVRQVTGVGGDVADDDGPFWSPDGKNLSFHSSRDGDQEVYTARLDGSGVRQLTFNVGADDAVVTWAKGKVRAGQDDD